ncbi:hypothetical protein PESP_b0729 [Pseudoalteromonas espejiana DSM 9414]|uniref:Uncharacterized protein n=1 Tax=Pseudoalteromonas espejiana TaxID=28107 RepID=A0A510XRQ1_9GAMM|nr:hypothetical protein [Pseudoalteromonas espejiana]ASM52248.1 hypothetical protein PESP_b0729 [Pseudoalteromonas espejiana DSM 9414]GEK53665.1 hypothetical protein PES01_05100 [Pseudoalteromonas espejiana]
MKHSIKIAMASLLVLGSTQVHANEVDLDVTDMITKNVKSYVNQATAEFKQSVSQSLSFDAQAVFDELVEQAQQDDDKSAKQPVTTEANVK